jgi:hypothetical protein
MVTVDDEKRGSSEHWSLSNRVVNPDCIRCNKQRRLDYAEKCIALSKIAIKCKRNKFAKYNSLFLEKKMKLSLSDTLMAHFSTNGPIFPTFDSTFVPPRISRQERGAKVAAITTFFAVVSSPLHSAEN